MNAYKQVHLGLPFQLALATFLLIHVTLSADCTTIRLVSFEIILHLVLPVFTV